MKKIYNIVSMAILLFCTAACSDSYLELSPESSVSDEVIFENADAAQYAVNGLGRIMSTQYLDTQGYNGEGTVYAYQGEYPGDVIQKGSYTGWQNLAKGNYFTSSTNSNIHVTWYYYYKLIRNANQILDNCTVEKQKTEEQRLNEYAMSSGQYRLKGEIYRQMGRPDEAVKFLKKYIEVDDSLKIANEQLASSEYATLLNVEKLNAEKKELMLRTKEKELSNKTTLIFSLIILLAILFLFLYRESRLNRRLKASESELRNKNEELTYSREELRKARDQAEATSQMKTTFIQSMSHEIRTPLNSIIGFSQVLSDHYGNEETKEFVNIIKANTDDLLRLVTDVLALSELDQYNKLPTNIQTDINAICQLAIEVAKMQKQDTVEFLFKPEREKLIILQQSGTHFASYLTNLAHNAIKFTTHGSIELTYSVLEAEKKLEISVTDTGIGIPKEKQESSIRTLLQNELLLTGHGPRTVDQPDDCRKVRRQPPHRFILYGRVPDGADSSFGIC